MTASVNISTASPHRRRPPGRERDVIDVLSRRIQAKRRERRLSLDQLSTRSGVSKGMLVQIERGATNPSIGTLCKVAAALGASIADLVDAAGSSHVGVVPAAGPRVLWKGPNGGSATLLVGSTGPDMLELWMWELRPGERYDAIAHPAGTQELLHVTHGRLAVTVDAVTYTIAAGRAASARTDRPHGYGCLGGRAVRFTMVVAERHS
jgi:DNA-binding XRE family transcriptional regulator/quercetin dioxygenase-like cupin family protein